MDPLTIALIGGAVRAWPAIRDYFSKKSSEDSESSEPESLEKKPSDLDELFFHSDVPEKEFYAEKDYSISID